MRTTTTTTTIYGFYDLHHNFVNLNSRTNISHVLSNYGIHTKRTYIPVKSAFTVDSKCWKKTEFIFEHENICIVLREGYL